MTKEQQADKVIGSHVVWALGGGLIPVPLFDIAAVTAIQIDMLKQLADVYEVEFSNSTGKAFVSGLTGSTFARLGASLIKAVPGIGTIIDGISMSAMSGASTYAVGQVAKSIFGSQGGLTEVDVQWAKDAYSEAFQRGKDSSPGSRRTGPRTCTIPWRSSASYESRASSPTTSSKPRSRSCWRGCRGDGDTGVRRAAQVRETGIS